MNSIQKQYNTSQRIPLVRAMTELSSAIAPFNLEEEVEHGLLRKSGLPSLSDVAIRETIANALVHRNYGLMGQVRAGDRERCPSVTSPGSFPMASRFTTLLSVLEIANPPWPMPSSGLAWLNGRTRNQPRSPPANSNSAGRRPTTRDPQTTEAPDAFWTGRSRAAAFIALSGLATQEWSTCGSSRCSTRCVRSGASPRPSSRGAPSFRR